MEQGARTSCLKNKQSTSKLAAIQAHSSWFDNQEQKKFDTKMITQWWLLVLSSQLSLSVGFQLGNSEPWQLLLLDYPIWSKTALLTSRNLTVKAAGTHSTYKIKIIIKNYYILLKFLKK